MAGHNVLNAEERVQDGGNAGYRTQDEPTRRRQARPQSRGSDGTSAPSSARSASARALGARDLMRRRPPLRCHDQTVSNSAANCDQTSLSLTLVLGQRPSARDSASESAAPAEEEKESEHKQKCQEQTLGQAPVR